MRPKVFVVSICNTQPCGGVLAYESCAMLGAYTAKTKHVALSNKIYRNGPIRSTRDQNIKM